MSIIFNTGKWTEKELDHLIRSAADISESGERIAFLSSRFLDTSYGEATLTGSITVPEELVINLAAMDCFTFIDYIEAMRLSQSFAEFPENLRRVRYPYAEISYTMRNHFFTDWLEYNADFVADITAKVGTNKTVRVRKSLNLQENGELYLPGIAVVERDLSYIPSGAVDGNVLNKLKTGDYIGIYSDKAGLDVSHVGIFIRSANALYLRHASSSKESRKVVDQEFSGYISQKPGILILRPK
jgi:hypothetical protein